MRILIVEDEKELSAAILKGLTKDGYAVDAVYDGEQALYECSINQYDLMILDLNLPKIDGLSVLRQIRQGNDDLKILILSARVKVADRIEGLDSGANDYLVKPFDFDELKARIRNLLRREFTQAPSKLQCGLLSMDTAAKSVFYGNEQIPLTPKEYGILEYLLVHQGKTVSAEEVTEHVWNNEFDPFSNTFRYHIHTLKKKLSAVSNVKNLIQTIRGQGYRLEEPL